MDKIKHSVQKSFKKLCSCRKLKRETERDIELTRLQLNNLGFYGYKAVIVGETKDVEEIYSALTRV